MTIQYKTKGVCSQQMNVKIEDGVVQKVEIVGGCHGNSQGVARLVEGPVSAMMPASVLQLHRHATVIVDEAAASQLQETEFYRFVDANRPEWQAY